MDTDRNNQQSSSFKSPWGDDINDSNTDVTFERINAEEYLISYTFFLIPEFPTFQLTGELIDLMPKWIEEICVSNRWKLEFVTVNPKYLQWALSIPAVIATMRVVDLVRSKLTENILSAAEEKMELGDSTDLWAPGYLLLHGIHPHPIDIIEQYILLVRKQHQRDSQ